MLTGQAKGVAMSQVKFSTSLDFASLGSRMYPHLAEETAAHCVREQINQAVRDMYALKFRTSARRLLDVAEASGGDLEALRAWALEALRPHVGALSVYEADLAAALAVESEKRR